MLGFLFGFNARLGRLHYFLASVGLAVVMTAICFVVAGYAYHHNPGRPLSPEDLMGWPMMVAIVFFVGASFTLQSMRMRDIGWDPVCVIPAWIAILIVDRLKSRSGRSDTGTTARLSVRCSIWGCCWRCCSGQVVTSKSRRSVRHRQGRMCRHSGPVQRRLRASRAGQDRDSAGEHFKRAF